MDSLRFDRIARGLAGGVDRRRIIKGLFGGAAVAATGGLASVQLAEASEGTCVESTEPRTAVGDYCNSGVAGDGHTCSAAANLVCDSSQPVLLDPYCAPIGGSCQCADAFTQSGDGSCIQDGSCNVDADCTGALVCETTGHTCVACVGNDNCQGDTPVCDTTTNTCVRC